MKHKSIKWVLAGIISLCMAIGVTRCHAQEGNYVDSLRAKHITDSVLISGYQVTTNSIGQIFYYNHGHDIIVRYSDSTWGPIHDSLTVLNSVYDKYYETLVLSRGYKTRIMLAFNIAAMLYYIYEDKTHKKLTKQELEQLKADIKQDTNDYIRLSKLYP